MRWILLACSTALAFAQGTEPKPKAAEYEVQGRSDQIEIGAEYMVHSFSGEGQTFIAENYLIVEVALYPPKDGTVTVNNGAFALRVNGKKPALSPQSPEMVAASMNRPGFLGGLSNPGVMMGGPVPGQTQGGSPFPIPGRTPTPRGPSSGPPGGIDRKGQPRADEVVVRSALPEGETKHPVSGFLYFPYKGKPSAIKSLELVYDRAVLKLR